jgi:DNA polymerase III epsilon subunit-like protein
MDMIQRYENNEAPEVGIIGSGDRAFWHEDYSSINYRKYIVVAVEVTGPDLQKDSLLSIGAIRMEGSRIELGKTFYRDLKPKSAFKLRNLISNGNDQAESDAKPDIEVILAEFADFCGKDIIVGHSVSTNMNFLDKAAGKIISPVVFNPRLDVLLIYEYLKGNHPALKRFLSYSGDSELSKLARRFGIPSNGGHDALKDAFVAAQLLQRFIRLLVNMGVKKMEDLEGIGNPFNQESRYMVSAEIINF